VRGTVSKRVGLAGAGTRDDQQWFVLAEAGLPDTVLNRGPLLRVEDSQVIVDCTRFGKLASAG
jgi:hypothetical protein